jgi:predicted RNA-binding protein with PUA-like domain
VVVELQPVEKLPKPVTLAQIKSDPALENIALLRQSRLSVVQLRPEEFDYILQLAYEK